MPGETNYPGPGDPEWHSRPEEAPEGWEAAIDSPTGALIQRAAEDLQAAANSRARNGVDPYSKWKTREGIVMDISDMGDRHLYHSLRMIWRECNEIHPGLNQEWRRRGRGEDSWKTEPPPARP
jgi:hypothetical protein